MRIESAAALRSAAFVLSCLVLLAVVPSHAHAVISAAETIDGPSGDVLDIGGVAMSEDGTGGVVYRRRVGGRAHVYAAQFAGGRWRAPQQVDVGQRFDSSWARIGAGDGGRLVVTWVRENGTDSDRMFSATIDPGARRFGAPVPLDMNVGEATFTWPHLSMSRGGQAALVYRVCKDPQRNPNLPPGTVECELRLARYSGQLWSPLGFPINRNPASPVTRPNADNAPEVAVDPSGNAVVAFQERDDDFIDRIWARRVFGSQIGIPLLVSPQAIGDKPLRAAADQLDLDVAGFGQATVGFRQRPSAADGGPVRIWEATIPESFVTEAAKFRAPRVADGQGAGGPGGAPGPAAVAAAPGGAIALMYSVGNQTLLATADDKAVATADRVDAGTSTDPGDPDVDLAETGALAAAWKVRVAGRGQVALLERRADGVPESRSVFAARGGRIVDLKLSGSGLGDALVAWQQGTDEFAQIAVASINAPPGEFGVNTPADFTNRKDRYRLQWDVPRNGIGDVTFAVTVEDDEIASGITRTRTELDLAKLDDGVIPVSVIARDEAGQETQSSPATFKLDRRAPRVVVERRKDRRVRLVVRDGAKDQTSGADHAATKVSWGDRRRAEGREGAFAITHRYAKPGRYRLVAEVRDLAGNTARVARSVVVR